jgi:hypothetical protein
MDYGFRIYVVSGEETVNEDFTTDDILDVAIDIINAETLPQMLNLLINGLNDGTLSDENWFFLYDENEMTLLSNIPNGFVNRESFKYKFKNN